MDRGVVTTASRHSRAARQQHLHHYRRAYRQGLPVRLHPPPESERSTALRHPGWQGIGEVG